MAENVHVMDIDVLGKMAIVSTVMKDTIPMKTPASLVQCTVEAKGIHVTL